MADLGDLLGSLMAGVLRARRVADEQTAALAEYYRSNPLLEGLSVPRIRIPELTIDMPLLIDDFVGGQQSVMGAPADITRAVSAQLKSSASKNEVKLNAVFQRSFAAELKRRLEALKKTGHPVLEESVARAAHEAFSHTLSKTKTALPRDALNGISGEIRASASAAGVSSPAQSSSIAANVKTAEVKELASGTSVVRLKITLREEGLEWAVRASDSGGVLRTLQVE